MQRVLLAVLVASLGAGTVQAQRPHPAHQPSRWVINGHSVAGLGTSVGPADGVGNELKTSSGLGGGVEVGYMITPRLTAYAGYEIIKQSIDVAGLDGDFGLKHLEAGARLSFPVRNSRLMPYLGAWVGRRSLTSTLQDFDTGQEADYSLSGLAAGMSGGVQYFVSPKLSLDGGLSLGLGKFGTEKIDGRSTDAPPVSRSTTTRVQFGASMHLGR
jgi:outer membrane protein with beta-barrel domain